MFAEEDEVARAERKKEKKSKKDGVKVDNVEEDEAVRAEKKRLKKEKKRGEEEHAAKSAAGVGKYTAYFDKPAAKTESAPVADSKKRKHSDVELGNSPAPSHAKKVMAVADDTDTFARRRTRSMSDAEESMLGALSPEEFRRMHQITIVGSAAEGQDRFACPPPMATFSSTPFAAPIRRCLESAGFLNPTATQAQCWPIALAGRDVITVAKTGSGKTIGFLLPAFHRLQAEFTSGRKRGYPAILVLAPTRELACQIEQESLKFGRTSNIRSACCYGGSPKGLQIRKLQAGVEIIIATPGRLNDLLETRVVDLSKISFLVLDEADRMLDM